jgi:hypothetical protein
MPRTATKRRTGCWSLGLACRSGFFFLTLTILIGFNSTLSLVSLEGRYSGSKRGELTVFVDIHNECFERQRENRTATSS